MKPSTAYSPSSSVAILVVGDPGSGKTRLGMSLPDPGIMDEDGNLASAVRISVGKKFLYSEGFRYDDGKEIPEIDRWNWAVKQTKELLSSPETKSFLLDGLSNLCRYGLIHCENELVKSGINIKKEYMAKYMSFIPLMTNFLTAIRIPGKPVMVTCHQIIEKAELEGTVRYILDIPGRMASNLGGQFTDVWGMSSVADVGSKIGAKYFIRTKPTGYHINLKTSLDLEPSIDITGKSPSEIWSLLSPKLSTPIQPTPAHAPAKAS